MRHAWLALPALATVTLAACPRPAAAHAILMESRPVVGAAIAPGPVHLVLRYNSRIDQARSRLELRAAGKPSVTLALTPSGPDTLEADTSLAPGSWTLRWQVLAVDGHITRGDVPVTVKAP